MNTLESFTSVKENKQWFLANIGALLKNYGGKYILIVNKEVVKSSHNDEGLIEFGLNHYGSGNFCVTLCTEQQEMIIAPIISIRYV